MNVNSVAIRARETIQSPTVRNRPGPNASASAWASESVDQNKRHAANRPARAHQNRRRSVPGTRAIPRWPYDSIIPIADAHITASVSLRDSVKDGIAFEAPTSDDAAP